MRRAFHRARNTAYLFASASTAWVVGVTQGQLRAVLGDDLADVETIENHRRRYRRARRVFRAVVQGFSRCDRETAEAMTDSLGFTRDGSASAPDLH